MRLEQIVEPGRPGAFFEGHGQSSTQSRQGLQNGGGFGFQDRFHDYLALSIHHRYADAIMGEDQEDTTLLRKMADEADAYIRSFSWYQRVLRSFFAGGVGGIFAVFLFNIDPARSEI